MSPSSSPRPIDIDRILKYAPAELIGREAETALLNDAWAKAQTSDLNRPRILTFVALGGEGKTSLVGVPTELSPAAIEAAYFGSDMAHGAVDGPTT